jgi:hypothetical protein
MNVMETVTVKFVARTVDKQVIYFTTIKSEALLIHEFWEKKLVKGYIAAKTRRTILPKLKIEEWNIYNKTIKQAGAEVRFHLRKKPEKYWGHLPFNKILRSSSIGRKKLRSSSILENIWGRLPFENKLRLSSIYTQVNYYNKFQKASFAVKCCLDSFPVWLGRTMGTVIIELTQSSWAGAGTELGKRKNLHLRLDNVLMKAHPTFEMFAKLLMGEWNKIECEMDHLVSGYTASDLRFVASMAERTTQERIYNVAMSVNSYHSIVDYLSAMAVASKK